MSSAYQMPLQFTLNPQPNDYTYVWEYYYSGQWRSMNQTWDLTNNFTTSGVVWNANSNWSTLTVNSVNGLWYRLRITVKGSATPTFSRVKTGLATGVGNWHIYEQMSLTTKILDESGSVLSGATLKLTDVAGNSTTITSDTSGVTAKTYLTDAVYEFDPVNGDPTVNVLRTSLNPFSIEVSKAGYKTYIGKTTLVEPTKLEFSLATTKSLNLSKLIGLV